MAWCCSGHSTIPREQFIFIVQVILVYIVVVTSIVNLSLNTGDREVWIVLLSSATGYLLPSPSMKDGGFLFKPPKQHERPEHDVIV